MLHKAKQKVSKLRTHNKLRCLQIHYSVKSFGKRRIQYNIYMRKFKNSVCLEVKLNVVNNSRLKPVPEGLKSQEVGPGGSKSHNQRGSHLICVVVEVFRQQYEITERQQANCSSAIHLKRRWCARQDNGRGGNSRSPSRVTVWLLFCNFHLKASVPSSMQCGKSGDMTQGRSVSRGVGVHQLLAASWLGFSSRRV